MSYSIDFLLSIVTRYGSYCVHNRTVYFNTFFITEICYPFFTFMRGPRIWSPAGIVEFGCKIDYVISGYVYIKRNKGKKKRTLEGLNKQKKNKNKNEVSRYGTQLS